jgi:hypothetical protein
MATKALFFSSVQFNLALAEKWSGSLRFRLRQCTFIKRKLALAENFSGPLRFRLRQVLLYLSLKWNTSKPRRKVQFAILLYTRGTLLVAQLVEALCYKPKGDGFESRWGYLNFLLT